MNRLFPLLAVAIASSACTTPSVERQPVPITSTNEIRDAAVVRRPVPPLVAGEPATASSNKSAPSAAVVVPPNTQYVCVSETNGVRQQTSIDFSAKVADLCRKHPEMGPCKYERDICRRANGRVYAANGREITMQTEAEYDKKVLRVVFKSN
jgi:hypothetical protein